MTSPEPHAPKKQAPKGKAWLVVYRRPGEVACNVHVEWCRDGLTAYEAWRQSSVPAAFSEVITAQLIPFSSVNTKAGYLHIGTAKPIEL